MKSQIAQAVADRPKKSSAVEGLGGGECALSPRRINSVGI
jgi:hypothetical protein